MINRKRIGNSSYDGSPSSYNTDKSYDLASWDDYVDWLKRCGHEADFAKIGGKDALVVTPMLSEHTRLFRTKREVYEWLLNEVDPAGEDLFDARGAINHNVNVEEISNE